MKKVFSFDAETNGLWGKAFAIGALVYDEQGVEIARFVGRLPDTEVTDAWVRENVLPKIGDIPVTHADYDELLASFAEFYKANKMDADVIVHMGFIVEVKPLRDLHAAGLIGDWDAPYPLLDVSGNLQQAGEDPTSVDGYVKKHELSVGECGRRNARSALRLRRRSRRLPPPDPQQVAHRSLGELHQQKPSARPSGTALSLFAQK